MTGYQIMFVQMSVCESGDMNGYQIISVHISVCESGDMNNGYLMCLSR